MQVQWHGSPGQLGLRVTWFLGHWVAGSQNVTQFHVWLTRWRNIETRTRGGSRILQGPWVSNPSERGIGGGSRAVPPRKFVYFLYQNGEYFLCIPGDIYWHCNCKPLREKTLAFTLQKKSTKVTLIKRARFRTPWTPPGSAPADRWNSPLFVPEQSNTSSDVDSWLN